MQGKAVKLLTILIVVNMSMSLVACGQTGPLYLPKKKPATMTSKNKIQQTTPMNTTQQPLSNQS